MAASNPAGWYGGRSLAGPACAASNCGSHAVFASSGPPWRPSPTGRTGHPHHRSRHPSYRAPSRGWRCSPLLLPRRSFEARAASSPVHRRHPQRAASACTSGQKWAQQHLLSVERRVGSVLRRLSHCGCHWCHGLRQWKIKLRPRRRQRGGEGARGGLRAELPRLACRVAWCRLILAQPMIVADGGDRLIFISLLFFRPNLTLQL